ncbi:MAG: hypothetical protein ACRC2U_01390 [Aeromonas sp.]
MGHLRRRQSGESAISFLWLIVAAACGTGIAYVFTFLVHELPSTAPFALSAIFLIPSTMCVQLVMKLLEMKEQGGINRDEKRRLNTILDAKVRSIVSVILLLLVSISVVISGFYFFAKTPDLLKIILLVAGTLVGISIYIAIWTVSETKDIYNFKKKVKDRETQNKNRKQGLKRLDAKAKEAEEKK